MKIALIGQGYLGTAYSKVFTDAILYDEPKIIKKWENFSSNDYPNGAKDAIKAARSDVNKCDIAMIAVPTDPLSDGSLDMSIVESVINWLETDLILIKSALMPGTVDRLVEKTGKNIAVSVEYIGMGNYYLPPDKYPDPLDPQKHKLLVVGSPDDNVAQACAEILWSKMSPDTRIHLVTAREAEVTKLIENFYGAYKVTFANCLYNLNTNGRTNALRVHQAWSEDGRVDPMHTRVIAGKRGWKSHCYDKDIAALMAYAKAVGSKDMQKLAQTIIELNEYHLTQND